MQFIPQQFNTNNNNQNNNDASTHPKKKINNLLKQLRSIRTMMIQINPLT